MAPQADGAIGICLCDRKTPEEICQSEGSLLSNHDNGQLGAAKKRIDNVICFLLCKYFGESEKKLSPRNLAAVIYLITQLKTSFHLTCSQTVCSGCQIVAGFSEWPLIVTVALRSLLPYQLKASAAPTPASVILTSSVQRQHCMGDQSGANLVCTQSPLATLAHSAHDNTSIISVAQSDIGSDHTCPWH